MIQSAGHIVGVVCTKFIQEMGSFSSAGKVIWEPASGSTEKWSMSLAKEIIGKLLLTNTSRCTRIQAWIYVSERFARDDVVCKLGVVYQLATVPIVTVEDIQLSRCKHWCSFRQFRMGRSPDAISIVYWDDSGWEAPPMQIHSNSDSPARILQNLMLWNPKRLLRKWGWTIYCKETVKRGTVAKKTVGS